MTSSTCTNPYERFRADQLILRDQLAIDRTVLANERTLLSYLRTGLALALTGAGCIKFFGTASMTTVGVAMIGLGLVVSGIGVWRFSVMKRNLRCVQEAN